MHLVLTNSKLCKTFGTILESLHLFTDTITLNFKKDSLFIQGMDHSHICLYETSITKSFFHQYECKQNVKIDIDLNILGKIFKSRQDGQHIEIRTMSQEALHVRFFNDDIQSIFKLNLLDIEQSVMDLSSMKHSCVFTIDTGLFKNIIDEITLFSDVFRTNVDAKRILFSSTSDVYGSFEKEIKLRKVNVQKQAPIDLSFNATYLKKILIHRFHSNVMLRLEQDSPMEIKFELPHQSYLRYIIAPSLDEDE